MEGGINAGEGGGRGGGTEKRKGKGVKVTREKEKEADAWREKRLTCLVRLLGLKKHPPKRFHRYN